MNQLNQMLILIGISTPPGLIHFVKNTNDISQTTFSRFFEGLGILIGVAVIGLIFGCMSWFISNSIVKLFNLNFKFFSTAWNMIFLITGLFSIICLIGTLQ